MTWFFLDVSFYGFSLDNRGILADLWATAPPPPLNASLPCWTSSLENGTSAVPSWKEQGYPLWVTDHTQPCNSMYSILIQQAKQYLLTVSIASIAGSACFIFAANRLPRRQWLTVSFCVLCVLFLCTGGVYYGVHHKEGAPATVAFVALCHFVFNFGANTLTFIIPAEIFPTAYRCTCHGISAAAGKLGSLVAVLIVYGINSGYTSSTRQGLIFLLFSFFMALGAIYSWAYLPNVQRRVYEAVPTTALGIGGRPLPGGAPPSGGPGMPPMQVSVGGGHGAGDVGRRGKGKLVAKNLEELGEGRAKARREGEVITIKDKWAEIKRKRTMRARNRRAHENAMHDGAMVNWERV